MLPLLELLADGEEHSLRAELEGLADGFGLGDAERKELLPSGKQRVFLNRLGWARTYLKKAGLLEYPRRGLMRITDRGQAVLNDRPSRIDSKFLEQFAGFRDFRLQRREPTLPSGSSSASVAITPEEQLEAAYVQVRADLAVEILEQIVSNSPEFFERLVVDLLVAMGYGGNLRDAGQALGRSCDGGVDGIIKEDRLGLDAIYLQAKRWEGSVGRPEIQKFAGALQGRRARKGVFITTSTFTKGAVEYVDAIESKIVLIDGDSLVEFMIDHGVGVSTVDTFEIKSLDTDYFEEG